jgi:hypothetical protein
VMMMQVDESVWPEIPEYYDEQFKRRSKWPWMRSMNVETYVACKQPSCESRIGFEVTCNEAF